MMCNQGTPEGVEDNGWLTRVAAFPIGIDPERFVEALERPEVKGSIAGLLNRYAGRKVFAFHCTLNTSKRILSSFYAAVHSSDGTA